MIVEMPYGIVEINSKEDAIYFIKNRCNNCPHSNEMWSCSSYQASICEAKEQELIQALKEAERNGLKEIR
jgi:hypothetical protein